MLYDADARQFELSPREQAHYELPQRVSYLDVYDGYLSDGRKIHTKREYLRFLDGLTEEGRPWPVHAVKYSAIERQIGELVTGRDALDTALRVAEHILFIEARNNF